MKSPKYTVILSPDELEYCKQAAKRRVNERTDRGREADLTNHIHGCYGEYTVSKRFNLPWEGIYYEGDQWEERGNDVKGIEVKASFKYHNWISLDPSDPEQFPDVPFVFVRLVKTGKKVAATLMGWIWGREASEDQKGRKVVSKKGNEFLVVNRSEFYQMDDLPLPE